MANDINTSIIVGRLTKDGELKYTNSGTAVLKFSIANGWSKKSGDNWEDQTNFFDASLWGRRAESLDQYLKKGVQVCVKAELRQDRWEQDGQKRSRVYLHANDIQLLGSNQSTNKNSSNGGQGYSQGNNQGNTGYQSTNGQSTGNFEDDIPF